MDGDFDRFVGELLGSIVGQSARQAPMPPVSSPATHQPAPQGFSPFGGSDVGTRLAQQIMAAQAAAQSQRPAPRPTPPPAAMGQQAAQVPMQTPNWVDPRAMASTAPVAGPIQESPEPVHGQAQGDEGYVIVRYTDQTGGQHVIFVPESYAGDLLPQNAEQIGDVTKNPQQIENARANGALLEQQPPEISAAFRNRRTSEQVYEDAAGDVDRSTLPGESPVIGEKTIEQRADAMSQLTPNVWTADDMEAAAQNPELEPDQAQGLIEHAALMRANGIESYDLNNEMLIEQDDGTVVVMTNDEYYSQFGGDGPVRDGNNPEPVGTPLPKLTRADVRETGNDALANEMERQGIYSVPYGQMLVRDAEGNLSLMDEADQAPEGYTIEVYGGRSERPDAPLLGGRREAAMALQALDFLDVPRRSLVYSEADLWYQWKTGERSQPPSFWSDSWATMSDSPIPDWATQNLGGFHWGLDFTAWLVKNEDEAIRVYEEGYTDPETGQTFMGGDAIWERYAADQPLAQRVINDLETDPLNFMFGAGGVLRGQASRVGTSTAGRRILSGTMEGAGRVLQAPDALMDRALSPVLRGAGRALTSETAQNAPVLGRVSRGAQWLASPSTRTALQRMYEDGMETAAELMSRGRRQAPEPPPAQVTGESTMPPGDASAPVDGPTQQRVGTGDVITTPDGEQIFVRRGQYEEAPTAPAGRQADQATTPPAGAVDDVIPGPAGRDVYNETGGAIGSPQEELDALGRADVDVEFLDSVERGDLKNPFEGMKIGEEPEPFSHNDWEWLTPQMRDQMHVDEQNRIIDAIYQAYGNTPEYRIFAELYEPLGLRFIAQERRAMQRSIASRPRRKSFDSAHMQASALNEARHVVNDLNPAYKSAFGQNAVLPEYRFKNEWKKGKPARNQNDQTLIEHAVFNTDDDIAAEARAEIMRRAAAGDGYLGALNPQNRIDTYRSRFMAQRSNTDPVYTVTQTPAPGATVPGQQRLVSPPEPQAAPLAVETQPTAQPQAGQQGLFVENEAVVPTQSIRSTATMSDEELAAAGLPRLQPREQAFSQGTVRRIASEGWDPDRYQPILVARGSDGGHYVVSGHSRLEAARQAGIPELRVRITDETDQNRLLEMARRENTDTTGFTPAERAAQVRADVDAGMPFDEIAQKHNFADDARGVIGTGEARKYYLASHLPEGRMTELFNQGDLRLDEAAIIGSGFQDGKLMPEDAQKIAGWLRNGDYTESQISMGVQRLIRNNMAPQQSSLGMIDGTFSQLDDAMEQVVSLSRNRQAAIADLKRDYSRIHLKGRSGADAFDTSRLSDAELEAFNARVSEIERMSTELNIPVERALVANAKPNTDIARIYRNDGSVDAGGQAPLWFSADAEARHRARGMYDRTSSLVDRYWGEAAQEAPTSQFVSQDTTPVERFMGRTLSEKERKFVNTRMSNGDTIGDRWQRYADELEGSVSTRPDPEGNIQQGPMSRQIAEEEALARAMDDYFEDYLEANFSTARRGRSRYDIYKSTKERLIKEGKDEAEASYQAMHAAIKGDTKATMNFYDSTLGVLREMTLYNSYTGSRYVMTQALGNSMTLLLTRHWGTMARMFSLENFRGAYFEMNPDMDNWVNRLLTRMIDEPMDSQTVQEAVDKISKMPAHMLHDSADEMIARFNIGTRRHDVSKVVRDQVTEATAGDMKMKSAADSLRLGRLKFPSKWTGVFASRTIRDIANAFDTTARKTLYADMMRANAADATPAFREQMRRNLPRGMDEARFNEIWDEMPPIFGADDVRSSFEEFGGGYAERMARDWQNSINKMDKHARQEVRRVFFSGEMTNADEIMQRVVFFHYWMSRATPLYVESLMRNPGMLNAYFKMIEEVREQAESGRYGQAVNEFLRVMGTIRGFNIFIRPDSLMPFVFSLGEPGEFVPENETGLGAFLRKSPIFFNPLIGAGVNFLGYSGSTFAPDPLQMGNWSNLAVNGINLLNRITGNTDRLPAQNWYQNAMSWGRSHTSGVLPGSHHVPYAESTLYARRDINFLIQDVAEENGLDPLGEEAMAAMDDVNHPFYQEAYKRYAEGQGMASIFRILPTSVLYPKVRIARGDEVRYNINSTPFGTDENQYWRDQRTAAQIIDPEARALWRQGDQYYDLGTAQQRKDYSTYNGIRYGGLDGTVMLDGVWVREKELATLSPDERLEAANRWAEQNNKMDGINELRDLRSEFNDRNPEWKAYQEWAGSVRNFEGGVDAYWEDLTANNPNAARWYEDNITQGMHPRDRQMVLTSANAYMATFGIRQTMYEPDPISTNSPSAQTQAYTPYQGEGQGRSGGSRSSSNATTAESIRDDIAEYQSAMAEYNAAAGVNMEGLNPMARRAYESNLRDQGVSAPRLSTRAQLYVEWAQAQPPGSDTSPEAYIRWMEEQ